MSSMDVEQTRIALQHALTNNELVLFYQPEFNLITKKFEALEALVRWHHPTLGMLMPEDFIPLIGECEVMTCLGEWVFKTACMQNKIWQERGCSPLRISVNVTGLHARQSNFVAFVMDCLQQTGLPVSAIELELTENLILHQNDQIVGVLEQLKQLGVSIALDDFGAGYASISYLKLLPLNRVKIDKRFVRDIEHSKEDLAILTAIIEIISSHHLCILVEGVETSAQLEMLRTLQCHEVQGNFFSEPIPTDQVEQFLLRHKWTSSGHR